MDWLDDSSHPFAGIAEKLKRANQNILNLDSEIKLFVERGDYPVLPDPDSEIWQEAIAYHKTKPIPLLFAVLSGEIIHHLRSCLDHVVWHFSDTTSREADPNGIEYPIMEQEPRNHDERKRYKRKIQGITNDNVLKLIEASQPYHAGPDIADNLLLIIHNMDRFDKHRELMIVASSAVGIIPPEMTELRLKLQLYTEGKVPESEHSSLIYAAQKYGKIRPGVAFRNFGRHSTYSLMRGLAELWRETRTRVDSFASEL